MPRQYIPIFIFAALAAAFPVVTLIIFKYIRPTSTTVGAKLKPYECGIPPEGDARGDQHREAPRRPGGEPERSQEEPARSQSVAMATNPIMKQKAANLVGPLERLVSAIKALGG